MGHHGKFRMKGDELFVTDEGNHILDLHLGRIGNARQLALILNQVPGVVENGLFLDMCDMLILGQPDGTVELRDIATGEPVRRYDVTIGYAAKPLPAGSWINENRLTMPAAPGIDDNRMRRSALPSVWPKPRSKGSMVTFA